VLPLGDTPYGAASLADYEASYDRRDAGGAHISWDRFSAISRPAPGNPKYTDRHPVTGADTLAGGRLDYFDGVGASTGTRGRARARVSLVRGARRRATRRHAG